MMTKSDRAINAQEKKYRLYHCKWCGKTLKRDSNKGWVKSYCGTAGKTVHLMAVQKPAPHSKKRSPDGSKKFRSES